MKGNTVKAGSPWEEGGDYKPGTVFSRNMRGGSLHLLMRFNEKGNFLQRKKKREEERMLERFSLDKELRR